MNYLNIRDALHFTYVRGRTRNILGAETKYLNNIIYTHFSPQTLNTLFSFTTMYPLSISIKFLSELHYS